MYATRTWSFHLSTKRAVIVRNWRPEISLGNKTGRKCTQPVPTRERGLGEEALEDYSDLVNEII